jgi:hypothetical protein
MSEQKPHGTDIIKKYQQQNHLLDRIWRGKKKLKKQAEKGQFSEVTTWPDKRN